MVAFTGLFAVVPGRVLDELAAHRERQTRIGHQLGFQHAVEVVHRAVAVPAHQAAGTVRIAEDEHLGPVHGDQPVAVEEAEVIQAALPQQVRGHRHGDVGHFPVGQTCKEVVHRVGGGDPLDGLSQKPFEVGAHLVPIPDVGPELPA